MDTIPYGKQTIDQDDIDQVINTLKHGYLTTGPKVKEFEDALKKYLEVNYCVVVSSGTAALHLASLCLLNINDKVLTTPNSFLATSNSILYANAKPIFVDITPDGNIDLDICREYLLKDTSIKALYCVHFSGNPINQNKLYDIKKDFNISILEDCAHSIGSKFDNIKSGNCKNSDISTFSFHPVKHITTGEGGALTTNNKNIYKKLLQLRNHGIEKNSTMEPWEYQMNHLGYNYRLTDLASSLGISQLQKLDTFITKRKTIAKFYDSSFRNTLVHPLYKYTENSSYHLYVVKVDFTKLALSKKDLFIKMKEKNIILQLHYIPINKQPFYKSLGYGNEEIPKMNEYYEQAFSLPLYPNLTQTQQRYVIKSLFEIIHA